jgi:hypothetical protein
MVRARRAACRAAAAGTLLVTAGCSASSSPPHSPPTVPAAPSYTQLAPPRARCGTTRTVVNVPITVEVEKGSVSCALAMRVQAAYAAAIRAGKIRGNGGGAPLSVDGWTCQSLNTTAILQTGEASHCGRDGTEIVAVLATQTGSASPGSPGSSGQAA